MSNQGPFYIVVETGKEHREGQKRRKKKELEAMIISIVISLFSCGYIYYLAYSAIHH